MHKVNHCLINDKFLCKSVMLYFFICCLGCLSIVPDTTKMHWLFYLFNGQIHYENDPSNSIRCTNKDLLDHFLKINYMSVTPPIERPLNVMKFQWGSKAENKRNCLVRDIHYVCAKCDVPHF